MTEFKILKEEDRPPITGAAWLRDDPEYGMELRGIDDHETGACAFAYEYQWEMTTNPDRQSQFDVVVKIGDEEKVFDIYWNVEPTWYIKETE
jgi:hypothetical protein